jgi:hypothetical protein
MLWLICGRRFFMGKTSQRSSSQCDHHSSSQCAISCPQHRSIGQNTLPHSRHFPPIAPCPHVRPTATLPAAAAAAAAQPISLFAMQPSLNILDTPVPQAPKPRTIETNYTRSLLNILAVKAYGEAEFWLSGGKVILIFLLFSFTFVTMVGGNPQHDAYGFRYWNKPGAFAEHLSSGAIGRFEALPSAL